MNNRSILLTLFISMLFNAETPCFGKNKKSRTRNTVAINHSKKNDETKKTHHKTLVLAQNTEDNQASENKSVSSEANNQQTEPASTETQKNHPYYIRVLLEEHAPQESYTLILKAKDGFVLESPAHSQVTALFQEEQLEITFKDGSFFMRCQDGKYRRIKRSDVEICSPHDKISLNGNTYQGSIHLCKDNAGTILVINKLELDDYLYSVIRHEGVPSWPHEMQKVQAVACRTYALYRMKQSRLKNSYMPYDITNTNASQVYKGSHDITHLRAAVDETHNMILTYNGNIAQAMFDICCGGIVSKNLRSRDASKPYLYRSEPCTCCKNSAYYKWQESFHKNTCLEKLKNNGKSKDKFSNFGDSLVDIIFTDKDKAGVVHKVTCVGKKKKVTLTGSELKSALGLKSLAFSCKKEGSRLLINGRGHHHFRGLCQLGAKELADRGRNFKEILQYYYPETKLSYLKSPA